MKTAFEILQIKPEIVSTITKYLIVFPINDIAWMSEQWDIHPSYNNASRVQVCSFRFVTYYNLHIVSSPRSLSSNIGVKRFELNIICMFVAVIKHNSREGLQRT